jgi:hypothetical protein
MAGYTHSRTADSGHRAPSHKSRSLLTPGPSLYNRRTPVAFEVAASIGIGRGRLVCFCFVAIRPDNPGASGSSFAQYNAIRQSGSRREARVNASIVIPRAYYSIRSTCRRGIVGVAVLKRAKQIGTVLDDVCCSVDRGVVVGHAVVEV